MPVHDNPFADSLQGNVGAAQQLLAAQESARRDTVGGLFRHMTLPGRLAQGVQTETPGVMTEADAFRQNQLEGEAQGWGPSQAMSMLSTGTPFAQSGALGSAGGAIKAYHGSPHDFEKFDIGKIGTGEGAQSYGHGLYFAENPATAESYRPPTPTPTNLPAWHPANFWTKAGEIESRPGKMYEVNINASPEHFLDWNKPLTTQQREVAAKLVPDRAAYYRNPNSSPSGASLYDDLAGGKYANHAAAADKLRDAGIPGIKYADQGSRGDPYFARPSGGGKYAVSGPGNISHSEDFDAREAAMAAADKLNAAVPRTHNYVVFNDKLIDIVKKYGLAGLVAGGAAHFKTQPVDHNPYAQ